MRKQVNTLIKSLNWPARLAASLVLCCAKFKLSPTGVHIAHSSVLLSTRVVGLTGATKLAVRLQLEAEEQKVRHLLLSTCALVASLHSSR